MVIIVIGAGKAGFRIARQLAQESHDVVLVDIDPDKLVAAQVLDVMTIEGNGANPKVLEEAGISHADMVIAVTRRDEVNMLACLTAKHYGVKTTVARVRNPEYTASPHALVKDQLGIDIILHPERLAAREIVNVLQAPVAAEVHRFAGGSVELYGTRITGQTSPWAGKTLEQLKLTDSLVVAIDRGDHLLIPGGKTRVLERDKVYLLGKTGHFTKNTLFSGHGDSRLETVTVMGGGETGFHACQLLQNLKKESHGLHRKISVKLIEKDEERARLLAEKLPDVLVIHGDGTNVDLLNSENISGTDAFVATTGHNETNIMAALLANSLGVKETVIRLDREEYASLAETVGVHATVVPRLILASTVLQLLQEDRLLDVTFIKQGRATVLDAMVPPGAPITRKPLKSSNFPHNALVGMVIRGNTATIPKGDTQIKAGDRVVVFSLSDAISPVRKIMGL